MTKKIDDYEKDRAEKEKLIKDLIDKRFKGKTIFP